MTVSSSPHPGGPEESTRPDDGEFKKVLGLPGLVLLGIVYMVPLTVFTTYGIVTEITGGRLPVAYALTLVVMLFTARSYGKMAGALPVSGSAYAYVSTSFGPGIGFLAGWSLLMDYVFLPMINYLVIGIYMNAALPMIPAWVFVLGTIALVTAVNLAGISSLAKANVAIVTVQTIFVVVFVIMSVSTLTGRGEVDLVGPLVGQGDTGGMTTLFAGAAILCLSFLGFDAVSTFAEESKDATRVVPRAIILTTLLAGALFVGLAYLSYVMLPTATFEDVDAASLDVMAEVGGSFLSTFFTAAAVAGGLGSALTSQASVARILFAMGRDGVLPKPIFGRLSRRGAPVAGIVITSAIALLALVLSLTTISSMISFGALVAFSLVNLTVIKYFVIDGGRRSPGELVSYLVMPLIGFASTAWLWTSLSSLTLIIGLCWAGAGLLYLAVLTRGFTRPTPQLDLGEH